MGAEAKTAVNPEKEIRKGEEPKTQAQAQSWADNPEPGGACGHGRSALRPYEEGCAATDSSSVTTRSNSSISGVLSSLRNSLTRAR